MIKSVLQLIRPLNLLIMALSMYLVRYCLIRTQLQLQILDLQMEDIDFILLTASVVFSAAAGYIINDYFDIEIDEINKPGKNLVGTLVSKKAAVNIFIGLSTISVALGFYEANKVGVIQLGFIHLFTIGLLWFYSSVFKRSLLIGNLIVSLLCAVTIILPLLYEPYRGLINASFVFAFAVFAFLVSLVREIIKDMEDAKGDSERGAKTLAIILGNKASKGISVGLSLVIVIMLALVQKIQIETHDKISFIYFTLAIQLPLLIVIYLTIKAKEPRNYATASMWAKITMVGGLLAMVVFRYTLMNG